MNSKRLSELRYKGHITDSEYNELKLAIKALEDRPQGEWIRHIRSIECSVCKDKFFADDENENCQDYEPCTDFNFNFCPNCGAKMTKEAEDEHL